MKKLLLLLVVVFTFSCKSSKRSASRSYKKTTKTVVSTKENSDSNTTGKQTVENIIKKAKTYKGTRHKYGGSDKKGIDCSGLVVNSFKSEQISLPRTTYALSTFGDWIDLKKVEKGDLLFFATQKNSRKVNHVGIVTKTRFGEVEFIHSTTSKGVITSNLSERFWYFAFVQARRVL